MYFYGAPHFTPHKRSSLIFVRGGKTLYIPVYSGMQRNYKQGLGEKAQLLALAGATCLVCILKKLVLYPQSDRHSHTLKKQEKAFRVLQLFITINEYLYILKMYITLQFFKKFCKH